MTHDSVPKHYIVPCQWPATITHFLHHNSIHEYLNFIAIKRELCWPGLMCFCQSWSRNQFQPIGAQNTRQLTNHRHENWFWFYLWFKCNSCHYNYNSNLLWLLIAAAAVLHYHSCFYIFTNQRCFQNNDNDFKKNI